MESWSRIIAFSAAICVTALLGVPLKRWLGFKKFCQLLCSTSLFALLSGRAMIFISGAAFQKLAFIYLANLLAGIVFALAITGGDKPDETFRLHPASVALSITLLFGVYIHIILGRATQDLFLFLYAMSVGGVAGCIFPGRTKT